MDSIRVRNALNRPRIFSVVDPEGENDAIRMCSGAIVNIDSRLLTPEIVENIKGGHLLLLEGHLPSKLNPYPEKKITTDKSDSPDVHVENTLNINDEESEDSGRKVFKKGVKN